MMAYQQSLAASAPAAPARHKKKRSGGLGAGFLKLALVAALCVGGYFLFDWAMRPPIPDYPSRPEFGTATMSLSYSSSDARFIIESETDHSGLVSRSTWSYPDGRSITVLTDALFVYVTADGVSWKRFSRGDPTFSVEPISGLMSMVHFTDWIPGAAEDYVSIGARDPLEVRGTSVTRFEMVLDLPEFADDERSAFNDYSARTGLTDRVAASMVLYVDDDGVVWRMDSSSDQANGGESVVVELISLSDEPLLIEYPTQFEDADGRVVSLAG